jgi:uncharacterized protein YciI
MPIFLETPESAMFLVLLHYKKPLEEVDRWSAEHRAFLEAHYASGHFLISGRRQPRTGGVILATGSREDIEAIVRRDPFHREQVADYDIIEFQPMMAAEPLAAFRMA